MFAPLFHQAYPRNKQLMTRIMTGKIAQCFFSERCDSEEITPNGQVVVQDSQSLSTGFLARAITTYFCASSDVIVQLWEVKGDIFMLVWQKFIPAQTGPVLTKTIVGRFLYFKS